MAITNALSVCRRSAKKHKLTLSRSRNTEGGIELGERGGREYSEAGEVCLPDYPVETAKKVFRRSLEKMFSDATIVEIVMRYIVHWEAGR